MDLGQIVLATGIPSLILSGVVGLLFTKFEKRLERKENIREKHDYLLIKSISAAMTLGEATAEAVQRIPDAHCNGDMHRALEYAKEVKHEQREFLAKQAVSGIL